MRSIFVAIVLLLVIIPCSSKAIEKGNKVILKRHRNADHYVYLYAKFYGQEWGKINLKPTGYSRSVGFDRENVILDIPPLKKELRPGTRVLANIRADKFQQDRSVFVPSEVIKENDGEYIVRPVCENKAPPLGIDDDYVVDKLPDDAFTASSFYFTWEPKYARLGSRMTMIDAWCAHRGDKKPWLQVDLQTNCYICSVTTKLSSNKRAVTSFTIAVSTDKQKWHHLMDKNNTRKIFTRGLNKHFVTNFVNLLDKPYRYICFYPVSHSNQPCMSLEVNGYANVPLPPHKLTIDRLRMEGSRCKLQNDCVKTKNAECGREGQYLGTYTCKCKYGFRGSSDFDPDKGSVSCLDIDECLQNDVCGIHGTCTNTPGSYRCNCIKGYENPNGILTICKDINECLSSPCSPHARCTNTGGSFSCLCNFGYKGDGYTCVDIDECKPDDGSSICKGKHSECNNLPGSYVCVCQGGFSGDGNTCTDINECDGNPNPCAANNGKCFNSIGSYSCHCSNGYKLEAGICQEIDECSNHTLNDCNQHATCTNKPGSYSCECKVGFTGSGYDRFGCSDIDECSEKNKCGAHSSCENSVGSFTCTCNKGYTCHNGMHCKDIDECKTGKVSCHHLATCKNFPGSFTCLCPGGYTGRGDVTGGCTAMSWCERKGDTKCNTEFRHCDNSLRRCTNCKSGYEEKKGICQDINECKKKPCGQGASCVNTPGSFKCHCHKGYLFNSKTKKCEDMDECSSTKPHCHVDALCDNTPGSYSCRCKKGYDGDGFFCADTNECYLGAYQCPANSVCSNTLGSYKCTCKMGYHRSKDMCKKDGTSKETISKKNSKLTSLFDLSFLWNSGTSQLRSQAIWKLLLLLTTLKLVISFVS